MCPMLCCYMLQAEGKLFTGTAARHMIGAPGLAIPRPDPDFEYKVFIQNHSRGSRCLIKGSTLLYRKVLCTIMHDPS